MALSDQTKPLMQRLVKGESLSTADIIAYGRNKKAPTAMIQALQDTRLSALTVIIDLGRPMLPENSEKMIPARPAPIVTDPDVVSCLVSLIEDGDAAIRKKACSSLAAIVPPSCLKSHTNAILAAIRRYPTMDGALILLGKTDSPQGLSLLEAMPELSSTSSDNAIMVRARLGDKKAEQSIIDAYEKAHNTEEKMALAARLGYVASERTIRLLASEIRSPEFIYWNKRSRHSLRIEIIEGLHMAFPTEPLFWKPFYIPSDDSYYDSIEKWLVANRGISWNRPRPPFLYEEEAPSAPPR